MLLGRVIPWTTNAFMPSSLRRLIFGGALGHTQVDVDFNRSDARHSNSVCLGVQGRIVIPNRDVWAIDPTVLVLPSGNYLVYSSWDGNYQCLWVACV